jgi:hypothetical protein
MSAWPPRTAILRARLPSRLRLSDPERYTLAEIGKRPGRTGLKPVACTAKPDPILAWYRRLVARKFDGSKHRCYSGRPSNVQKLKPPPAPAEVAQAQRLAVEVEPPDDFAGSKDRSDLIEVTTARIPHLLTGCTSPCDTRRNARRQVWG